MSSHKASISSQTPCEENLKPLDEKTSQIVSVAALEHGGIVTTQLAKIEEVIETEQHITAEEGRRLRNKIDRYTVPCLLAIYGLQFADKVSLSAGVLFGLVKDTHLKSQDFAWLSTIYYLGYFIFQPLMNYGMQRMDAAYVVSAMTVVWGAVLVTLGLCKSFTSLMVVRFILGAMEGVVTPAFTLIVASWYKQSEQNARQLWYFSMNTFFSLWVTVVIYFISKRAQDEGHISGWRVINFFLGGLTVFAGIMTGIFLRLPKNAWWLTETERKQARARIIDNGVGTGETQPWKWDQVRDALTDPNTYFVLSIMVSSCIPNGGITTFNSLIYRSFNFTPLNSILYQLPSVSVSFCWILFAAYMIHRWPRLRFFFMCFSVLLSFIAVLSTGLLPHTSKYKWVKWGVYMMNPLYALQTFLMVSLMTTNIGGRTKKTTVFTLAFMAYCVGNMIGPQVFRAKDAPRYTHGLIVTASMLALVFVLCLGWLLYLITENKRRTRVLAEMGVSEEERVLKSKINGELDMTDNKNIYFLYNW